MLQETNSGRIKLTIILVVISILGLAIRGVGLTKEPIWLDEACSAEFSSGSVSRVLIVNARDSHPPVYYLALKGWRVLFGNSPEGLRSYSLFWSVLGLVLVGLLAAEISGSNRVAAFAAAFMAVHPLDLWFAQEARMYTQLSALGVASTFALWKWLERRPAQRSVFWLAAYVVAAAAALYTHYVFVFLIAAQVTASVVKLGVSRDRVGLLWLTGAVGVCGSMFAPWLVYLGTINAGLYNPVSLGWIPKPQISDVVSLYWFTLMGRAGNFRPPLDTVFSGIVVVVLIAALVVLSTNTSRRHLARWPLAFVFLLAFAPVGFSFLVGVLYCPVFYAPRIGVIVLPYFVVILAMTVAAIATPVIKRTIFTLIILVMGASSVQQHLVVSKRGMGEFADVYRKDDPPEFLVFFPGHNAILASYFLQETQRQPTPEQIKTALRSNRPTRIWVLAEKEKPFRSNPSLDRNEYYEWLLSLGPSRKFAVVDGMDLVEVDAQPAAKEYPALPLGQRVEFGTDSSAQYLWSGWFHPKQSFRWSNGNTATVVYSHDEAADVLRIRLSCFRSQRISIELNGHAVTVLTCAERSSHIREFDVADVSAAGPNELVFHLPDAVAPAAVSESRDGRKLAIAVEWIELE